MPDTTTANDNLLNEINELFRRLADVLRKSIVLKNTFDAENQARKTTFDAENAKLESERRVLTTELRSLIVRNRTALLGTDIKSFATEFAKFSFRNVNDTFKVVDKSGALAVARTLGIMRKVCTVRVVYTVDAAKLSAYLEKRPEHREAFTDFVSWPPDVKRESLTAKPNDTYHTRHDTSRLTAKPISLNEDED